MSYYINPEALSAVFTVPCSVVDNGLKLATEQQLKVLLYILRNLSNGIDPINAAQTLGIQKNEAEDAILYWQQNGIFSAAAEPEKTDISQNVPIVRNLRPTRSDVAHRGLEDPQVRFLFQEAQLRFGRNLKSNEAATLLWLYDDQGMDISIILMLLQYAASAEKLNVSFLEKTAVMWLKNGVKTVDEAEKQIAGSIRQEAAWHIVEAAFDIKKRRPSPKELQKADLWINEWKISRELLHCAYNACVDIKSEFNFAYTAKIIEDWYKRGILTPEAVEKDAAAHTAEKENLKNNGKEKGSASYQLDEFERMLERED